MPELPEVETIKRGLEKYLVGRRIVGVEVRLERQFEGKREDVAGARVIGARRFGKGLVIDLDNGNSLAIHVKMTGQLIYGGQLDEKHVHVVFELDNGSFLFYRDIRKFGWIRVVRSGELARMDFFRNLGPEPLRDLTELRFGELLKKSGMPIKSLLMDQKKIAGIGNIYANDALYIAKIDPRRVGSSLNVVEREALFEAVEEVLRKGIEVGGASSANYVNVQGAKGGYQNFFKVYRKEGELCERCGSKIQRIKMGGRGTFFCGGCQR